MDKFTCKACSQKISSSIFHVSDFYDGGNKEYAYGLCNLCGSISLTEDVDDNSLYHENYYSIKSSNISKFARIINYFKLKLKYILLKKENKLILSHNIFLSEFLKYADDKQNGKYLDVGCGVGEFLKTLSIFGYKDLTGIDPYLPNDFNSPPGIKITKGSIDVECQVYDGIIVHHVLEHVADPTSFMQSVRSSLSDDGLVFLSLPVKGVIFEQYREFAYTLQAPHHKFLINRRHLKNLLNSIGFKVISEKVDNFSTRPWLIMSELWKNGICEKLYRPALDCLVDATVTQRLDELAFNSAKIENGENLILVLKKI